MTAISHLQYQIGGSSYQKRLISPLYPDSIPPSDRRWLLVARSADFADVGLPTTTWVRFLNILPTLGQRWTNGGFLFKMAASNNRGFGET